MLKFNLALKNNNEKVWILEKKISIEVEKRVRVRNRAKAMLAFDLNIQLKILTFL